MARTKYQKPRPGKQTTQSHNKKRGGGKENDISELRAQLDALGLKIIHVTADGNCFFRALADQLEGNEDEHEKYRRMIVNFIKENREMFEPFVEDEPFDEYCRSMAEDGTWAGNIELQAASLVTRCNICIHRHMYPRWYIQNFDKHEVRMVHISYHDGEHYNSVRTKDDTCLGPARSIVIKGEAEVSVKSRKQKAASIRKEAESKKNVSDGCLEDGTENMKEFEQGDDAEVSVAEKESLDSTAAEDESHPNKSSCDESQVANSEQSELKGRGSKKSFPSDEKKSIPRNKNCPCGSKKKYKACCGKASSKVSAGFPVHKDQKQCRKGSSTINKEDGGPLDMGALCI